jgi:hypothetical protein
MTQPVSDKGLKKLSSNPNTAILEMMAIIDAFRTLMIKENTALESADANGFLILQDEKLNVARDYQVGIADLLARREQIRKADPSLHNKLAAMQRGFHNIAEQNLQGLERMKKGTDRLRDRIMVMARDVALQESRFAYGASGAMQSGGKATIGVSEQA